MAQRHLESSERLNGNDVDVLGCYLRSQATEFLRSLRQHRESGAAGDTADAARALRRAARRISGTLHTFRPLLDTDWSDALRPELAWLSGTLAREHAYASRLDRLASALHTLTSPPDPAPQSPAGLGAAAPALGNLPSPSSSTSSEQGRPHRAAGWARRPPAPRADTTASTPAPAPRADTTAPAPERHPEPRDTLTLGAAKASALLDRQLTLARTRAHSTALQALGSARFHAVADNVAVLASDVPLTTADTGLEKLAAEADSRLAEAATTLHHTSHPYSPDADAAWHHVRLLLRLHRYAREVVSSAPVDVRLLDAADALNAHRDAAEAAAAAAHAARTPRIAPTTAYALGVLHADQRHEVAAARLAFGQAWQRQTVGTP
ncbi:CHAD domain-containing protein [Streptomyces sp. NBC_00006]|uniref:CHAD domain-containing protein n=1 Tax=Streptomyces sp. NBC_00006 TaxID=2975619 RepID=UPI002252821D|nr:CHAD domain-containing protein [Streptomyces sp. NBC_00006]MCX5532268.1 CHAD domain-containing protein [Streptomyces sp. NBC_00006]